jgi:hypothetical protein
MTLVRITAAAACALFACAALAAEGLITIKSPHSPAETASCFEAAVKQRLTVFARIDHAAGASADGKTLRPTELFILAAPRQVRHSWCASNSGDRPAAQGLDLAGRVSSDVTPPRFWGCHHNRSLSHARV